MSMLNGAVAVVTGGSAGIGASICARLAERGAKVIAADLRPPSHEAAHIPVDIADPESVDQLFAEVTDRFGSVDVLVNNAGIFSTLSPTPFTEISAAEWRRVFEVNVIGVANCCRSVMAAMGPGGRIINIASASAFKGLPSFLHYVSSKGAVLAMTRALAREVAPRDIRVNAVAPGFTLSEAVRNNPDLFDGMHDSSVAGRLLRRDQEPDDVAGVVAFLAGDDAAFLTGQTIVVDGGSVLH
jgi:NAD(P)-dependent dehydrogenase (short-subunit alcohol dehydrogenase family)